MVANTGSWGNKDPDTKWDYDIDWSDVLGNDIITTSTWAVVQGTVILSGDIVADTQTKVFIEGGTNGEVCLILNHIETAGGRKDDCTMRLDIRTM